MILISLKLFLDFLIFLPIALITSNHTNLLSNESNSATVNINSTTNYTNKNKTNSHSNKIKSIKSFINKNKYDFFKQNNKQLNGLQIKIKSRFEFELPLLLDKSKDKNDNNNHTNNENTKFNSVKKLKDMKIILYHQITKIKVMN